MITRNRALCVTIYGRRLRDNDHGNNEGESVVTNEGVEQIAAVIRSDAVSIDFVGSKKLICTLNHNCDDLRNVPASKIGGLDSVATSEV